MKKRRKSTTTTAIKARNDPRLIALVQEYVEREKEARLDGRIAVADVWGKVASDLMRVTRINVWSEISPGDEPGVK